MVIIREDRERKIYIYMAPETTHFLLKFIANFIFIKRSKGKIVTKNINISNAFPAVPSMDRWLMA